MPEEIRSLRQNANSVVPGGCPGCDPGTGLRCAQQAGLLEGKDEGWTSRRQPLPNRVTSELPVIRPLSAGVTSLLGGRGALALRTSSVPR
jgi:hypothetical protein